MRKTFHKKFGRASDENCNMIKTTTWDGKGDVMIIFPKKLTSKLKKEVEDFLLGELDDHDAYDKFKLLKEEKMTKDKIKDIFDGEYINVWGDEDMVFFATPFATLNFSKEEWEAFKRDIDKLSDL